MNTTQLYDSISGLGRINTDEKKLAALQLFIDFYEGTNAKSWCCGQYTKADKCCALGHLQIKDPNANEMNRKWAFLRHKVSEVSDLLIIYINDFGAPLKANPRTRILTALRRREQAMRLGLNSCPACGQAHTKQNHSRCDGCEKLVGIGRT